ncbi:MAG TPA: helix-turn-helix transcriptional regulator [bacterium]|nr:helix-turn-helix transcriptional regulator [bacterium]
MSAKTTRYWKPRPVFRILTAGITIDPPGATYGPRLSRHYEFIWIMEGDVQLHFDQKVLTGGPGMVFLRGAGVRDYYEWSPRRRTVHGYVHFDLDPARKAWLERSRPPLFRKVSGNDMLHPLMGYLLENEEQKEPLRSRLVLPALDLLLQAFATGRTQWRGQPSSTLPAAVERSLEAIRARTSKTPPEPLRLSDLASAANTTPENLCRLFQKSLQVGPLEFVKLTKLDRAANYLRRTSLGLKEIAEATGFYDAFHLSRTFKQVYGVSPKEFKGSAYNEWISQRNPIIRTLYVHSQADFLKPPPGTPPQKETLDRRDARR